MRAAADDERVEASVRTRLPRGDPDRPSAGREHRAPGEPPPTLIEYLPEDALVFLDESRVMLPQLRVFSL